MKSYIIQCRTLSKISEVNCLKIGGVVRVSELDHQFFFFFSRRPGTNSTGGLKLPLGQYGHVGLYSTSTSLAAFSSCVTSLISGLGYPSNWTNQLRACILFNLLRHIYVGFTNISFFGGFSYNPFSRTFCTFYYSLFDLVWSHVIL